MPLTNHNAALELSVADMRDHFCVYAQYLNGENETPFYVGVCKLVDVFKYPDAYKNTHWRKTINDQSTIKTLIVATSDKVAECYHNHNFIVTNYKPTCNVLGYQAAGKTVITCIKGPNAGQSYATQLEAATKNGISQPSLCNHLNGRAGYENVRGMIFKRGT